MGNKAKKKNATVEESNMKMQRSLKIILLVALSIIVFYPPYLQGLFFEKDVLPAALFVFVVFIIFCINKWLKKDDRFIKTPIDYAALGFVVVYFISTFVAVHTRSAIIELLKYCMYFAVFYMISELADDLKTKLLFLWIIVASATGVSLIGLDSAICGNLVQVLNKIFNFFGVKGDLFFGLFVNSRVHSTLQYPNALASYVMAVFFITIGILITSNRVWIKAISGACAYILFLTFMLTQSRGAQLLFPAVFIIFIVASPRAMRIKSAVCTLIMAISAAVISFLVTPYLSKAEFSVKAFLMIVAGLIVTLVLSLITKDINIVFKKVGLKTYLVFLLLLIVLFLGTSFVIQANVPLELSHSLNEESSSKMIIRDIVLTPGKEYQLVFEAETNLDVEQPQVYNVRICKKNMRDILFSGQTVLVNKHYKESDGIVEENIPFTVPDDSKLISIIFTNYYTGTSVTLNNAKIIDAETGKTVKKIILKNKFGIETFLTRLSNMRYDQSGQLRLVYYRDGLKVLKNRLIFGSGGGAWEYLYHQYQSYNYQSTQAHNYPLQLGIETGVTGIMILVYLIITVIHLFIKYNKKQRDIQIAGNQSELEADSTRIIFASVTTAIVSLLMHSAFDFDFSESAILLLFWQLIAMFSSEVRRTLVFSDMMHFSKNITVIKKRSNLNNTGVRVGISACIIVTVISIVFCSKFLKGTSYAQKAYKALTDNKLEEAIEAITEAIETDKYNENYVIGYRPILSRPDVKAGLADILLMKSNILKNRENSGENISQTEMSTFQRQFAQLNNYIKRIEEKVNTNVNLSNNLASFYFGTGQIDKGITCLNQSVKLFPLEPTMWNSKVSIYYQLMVKYYNDEDYPNAEKYLEAALDVVDEATKVNERNMNPFILNEETIEMLQTIQFVKDKWNDNASLAEINEIIHYTIPYLDVDHDKIPDQWKSNNPELVSMSATEKGIEVNVSEGSFIYTQYPIKLESGKKYIVEVKLNKALESISYEVVGMTGNSPFQAIDDYWYVSELIAENDSENILRIYLESDCVIESIIIKEIIS